MAQTSRAQTNIASVKVTLLAATPATILAANAWTEGARVVNWTASPVYLAPGDTGTPTSGAPSDFVPAASGGIPGQWEAPFAPKTGLRAVGASAGDLTVQSW